MTEATSPARRRAAVPASAATMAGRHVIVVGGGASGAIAAAHLLREPQVGLHVTIVDPGDRLGHGLAYGTSSPSHLLNARARSMSAFDDRPDDFTRWLAGACGGGDRSEAYVERSLYSRYLEDLTRAHRAGTGDGTLTHVRAAAVRLAEHGEGVRVDLAGGGSVQGAAAVLALGHGLLREPPRVRSEAPAGDVLVLGTGLGMVDQVLGLLDAGHAGNIVALSRRGRLPQAHGIRRTRGLDAADVPFGTSLSSLLHWLRTEARSVPDWRDLVDALRPHVPELWAKLPPDARRRFLRHARPWWDSHRHRMAPAVAARIAAARASGRLSIVAGSVVDRHRTPSAETVTWRPRGGRDLREQAFAEVIDCTGPRRGPLSTDALVRSLLHAGIARLDPLGLGLEVSPALEVLGTHRHREPQRLFAIGPLTCGLAWETYAVPEIRGQCAIVASRIRGALDGMHGSVGPATFAKPARPHAARPGQALQPLDS
jgi:uncharacterized NAD(P)/FAD-binding protein YdhS